MWGHGEPTPFRQGAEPIGEGLAWLVVEEAAVELVADGDGEAGDFSSAGHEGRGS